MTTDFNKLLPDGLLFTLVQVQDMRVIKIDMAKKLIYNNELEIVKIGTKVHVSRTELIRFLENNTYSKDSKVVMRSSCNRVASDNGLMNTKDKDEL